MNAKEVLKELESGGVLCMEHTQDGEAFWLEPGKIRIRRDVAVRVIMKSVPGGDSLFEGVPSQTFRGTVRGGSAE